MNKASKKVSEAILQKDSKILVGGEEYFVPAPTYGTLIRLSEFINDAEIPIDGDNIQVADLISLAKNESLAPAVLATLILGAKECDLPHEEPVRKYLFGFIPYARKTTKNGIKTKLEYLTEYFTNEAPVSDIVNAIIEIVSNRMDLVFFWKGITFLKGMNQTKATKETSQTVVGQ